MTWAWVLLLVFTDWDPFDVPGQELLDHAHGHGELVATAHLDDEGLTTPAEVHPSENILLLLLSIQFPSEWGEGLKLLNKNRQD